MNRSSTMLAMQLKWHWSTFQPILTKFSRSSTLFIWHHSSNLLWFILHNGTYLVAMRKLLFYQNFQCSHFSNPDTNFSMFKIFIDDFSDKFLDFTFSFSRSEIPIPPHYPPPHHIPPPFWCLSLFHIRWSYSLLSWPSSPNLPLSRFWRPFQHKKTRCT